MVRQQVSLNDLALLLPALTKPRGMLRRNATVKPFLVSLVKPVAYLKSELTGIHENVFSANLNGVAIHPHRWILPNLAGDNIILPAMPRTRHHISVHNTLPQRPATMQTGIVDGIELAAYICQGNCFALHLKLSDRSGRDLIRLRCSHERHLSSLSSFPLSL